jgi:hypothetical protein
MDSGVENLLLGAVEKVDFLPQSTQRRRKVRKVKYM